MITKKDESLGKQIKKQRRKLGYTQDQLAEKSGLSTKYIQFVESASRTPSLKTLYRIAKALGVKVKDLFHF